MRILIFGAGGISQGIHDFLRDDVDLVFQLTLDDCDVTFPTAVQYAIEDYRPDWIINCAGVSYARSLSLGDVREEIEVNLLGAINVACMAGNIPQIHLVSVAGLYGKPEHMGYCASKAGLRSVIQSLAMEGKRIWGISPGRVDTEMRERDYPNDTPGSRLEPWRIGQVVEEIMDGLYPPGSNIIIRKQGLVDIIREVDDGEPWKTTLRVGQPVTI